jgi:hypothetical protein
MKIKPQEVFNRAWQRFIVEGAKPALGPGALPNGRLVCTYLTQDGDKCAIGLCIPDGHRAQSCVYAVQDAYKKGYMEDLMDEEDTEVLQNLQFELHDGLIDFDKNDWAYTPETLKKEYMNVARRYNLTVPGGQNE